MLSRTVFMIIQALRDHMRSTLQISSHFVLGLKKAPQKKITYAKPANGHFGREKVCMRQLVGCATCAKVSWIENCFPCYLFQDCPDALRPRDENDADDTDDEAASDIERHQREESSDEEAHATEQRRGRLLKDEHGFYVIDPHKIHELLDVNK